MSMKTTMTLALLCQKAQEESKKLEELQDEVDQNFDSFYDNLVNGHKSVLQQIKTAQAKKEKFMWVMTPSKSYFFPLDRGQVEKQIEKFDCLTDPISLVAHHTAIRVGIEGYIYPVNRSKALNFAEKARSGMPLHAEDVAAETSLQRSYA